ncbi:MAG: VOC family protein [Proteobacteria bacterium]|nr:VOC family protein [Pseudomonadota bacterium]MDA1059327.1 VOC family protein [Pseudomonadota bacterium]
MTNPTVVGQHYVLAVPDIEATARWWTEVMGFEVWMTPEGWIYVRRGTCSVMVGECPDAMPPKDLGDHAYFAYIEMDDLDAYHAEVTARGLAVAPPTDKPWGMREMMVKTPDGHRIMFGQDLSAADQ